MSRKRCDTRSPYRISSCIHATYQRDAGVTAALAHIFKAGRRQQLLTALPAVWPAAVQLPASPVAASNVLARKLAVKLVQRMGLALLPLRSAAWAHSATVTSLAVTLQHDGAAAEEAHQQSATGAAAACEGEQRADADSGDEHDEGVPEELEQVIQVLCPADSATIVCGS